MMARPVDQCVHHGTRGVCLLRCDPRGNMTSHPPAAHAGRCMSRVHHAHVHTSTYPPAHAPTHVMPCRAPQPLLDRIPGTRSSRLSPSCARAHSLHLVKSATQLDTHWRICIHPRTMSPETHIRRYAVVAAANFTVLLGGFGATTPASKLQNGTTHTRCMFTMHVAPQHAPTQCRHYTTTPQ
jgi:hypothetical protein